MSERFYEAPVGDDRRRSAPAALRNIGPIGDVLAEWLPRRGTVLELASGTGEHALAYARRFPHLQWQPTDVAPEALASAAAWQEGGPPNLLRPIALDVESATWGIESADAIVAFNLAHISPWAASLGLLKGAERLLGPGASLILYGPWIEDEVPTAPSNIAFDADLRSRNPEWGLRNVAAFRAAADACGLSLDARRGMPANNIMLRFLRR